MVKYFVHNCMDGGVVRRIQDFAHKEWLDEAPQDLAALDAHYLLVHVAAKLRCNIARINILLVE